MQIICSPTEENCIKAIFLIEQGKNDKTIKTSHLASWLKQTPPTVTDTIDRLSKKGVVLYKKYQGVRLSSLGHKMALNVIRRHRLWEFFLHNTLHFTWDEIHEVAEELEHIQSPLLIERLDKFLGYPIKDPHGDFIPNKKGELQANNYQQLHLTTVGAKVRIEAVENTEKTFLRYLDKLNIKIGSTYTVQTIESYDGSIQIKGNKQRPIHLSQQTAQNIFVTVLRE